MLSRPSHKFEQYPNHSCLFGDLAHHSGGPRHIQVNQNTCYPRCFITPPFFTMSERAPDHASSAKTSTWGQEALSVRAVGPVLMCCFPRACASPRDPILFPPRKRCPTKAPGSIERSTPTMTRSFNRASGAIQQCCTYSENIMTTCKTDAPRADDRASDSSRSQGRSSAGRENRRRHDGPSAAHLSLTAVDEDPSTNS